MKNVAIIVAATLVLAALPPSAAAQSNIYVSPDGKGNGSRQHPASIERALDKVAAINRKQPCDITLWLTEGTYRLERPLELDTRHSADPNHRLTIRNCQGQRVVICGSERIEGWSRREDGLIVAPLCRDHKLRSLYVNGQRATMASTEEPVAALGGCGEFVIDGNEQWADGAGRVAAGILFESDLLPATDNPTDVELRQASIWTEATVCADRIERDGGLAKVILQQPLGAIIASLGWVTKIDMNGGFYVRNTPSLVDRAGEFCFDRQAQQIVYCDRGEQIDRIEAEVPRSKGLLRIKGNSTDDRVTNITVEGLIFCYDDWSLMEIDGSAGAGGVQSIALGVRYVPDGNWHSSFYNSTDLPQATIEVSNASGIEISGNRFEHIGSGVAVALLNDVTESSVRGNSFDDLTGSAISVGHPQHYATGDGARWKGSTEGVCSIIEVSNNTIRNTGVDLAQAEAIVAFYVDHTSIEHNDIDYTSYCGIACGWGSGNSGNAPSQNGHHNSVSYNRVGHTNRSLAYGGSLYLLGCQPQSRMEGNYLFAPSEGQTAMIVIDDGASEWRVVNNVIDNPPVRWVSMWSPLCMRNQLIGNSVTDNLLLDNGTETSIDSTRLFYRRPFDSKAERIISDAGTKQ